MTETLPAPSQDKLLQFLGNTILDAQYLAGTKEKGDVYNYILEIKNRDENLTMIDNFQSLAQVFGNSQEAQRIVTRIAEQLIIDKKATGLDAALVCGAMIFPKNEELFNDFGTIMEKEFGSDEQLPIAQRAKRVLRIMAALKRGGVEDDFGVNYHKLVDGRLIQPGQEIQVDQLIEALTPDLDKGRPVKLSETDSNGDDLLFFVNKKGKAVLSASIVGSDHPEAKDHYVFKTFTEAQQALDGALTLFSDKEIEIKLELNPEKAEAVEIELDNILGPGIKVLTKPEIELLVSASTPLEAVKQILLSRVRQEDRLWKIPVKKVFLLTYLTFTNTFGNLGWLDKGAGNKNFDRVWEEVQAEVEKHWSYAKSEPPVEEKKTSGPPRSKISKGL